MFISIRDSVGVILSLCVDFCPVRLFSRCFSRVWTRLCAAVQIKWAGQLTLPLRGTPRHDAQIWTVNFLQEAGRVSEGPRRAEIYSGSECLRSVSFNNLHIQQIEN